MRLPDFDKRLEPAFKELARALARFDEAQGLVDRRNARQAYHKAEAKLRKLVDGYYPQQRRKTKQRRKRRTPTERVRHLKRAGWKEISSKVVLERLAAAGIRVERVKFSPRPGAPSHSNDSYDVLGPVWAVLIASHAPTRLAAAKDSLRERRAILVELALND